MKWSGSNIERVQSGIEQTLETKARDVENHELRIHEISERLEDIESAISNVARDETIQEVLGESRDEREQEMDAEQQAAANLQDDLAFLLNLVSEGEEASARDADALAALRAIGEDVQEAERIVDSRRAWAEETRAKILELMDRIGGKVTEPVTRMTATRRLSNNIDHSDSPDTPIDSNRYVHPDSMVTSRFQTLVDTFGSTNPAGWINAGNPLYSTGDVKWMNNCGSCARSFADTFHGIGFHPAMGDGRIPPGEYSEMWDALGTQPTSKMTNHHAEPAAFRESAHQALAASLRREGVGAVAIIGVDWDVPGVARGAAGGHWFNAYVAQDGMIKWADMQTGKLADWPPRYSSDIWRIEAVVRTSAEAPWKELVL